MNIRGNLNLARLENVGCATIHGKQCVVIPITENDIYVQKNETGGFKHLSLSINVWEKKDGADQYGNTHYIQQNLSKQYRDANPDKKVYLGDMKPIELNGGNAAQNLTVADAPYTDVETHGKNDDLPF